MVAKSILKHIELSFYGGDRNLLFLVIRRVCEYTGVKTARDAIATFDYHSMLIRFQEFVVKNDRPLSMVHFSMTMG
jgi:hypothetical protein